MENKTTLSAQLGALLREHRYVITTAESCTGGGIASAITDIAGSSAWFDRTFVTYSNDAKQEMLGVKASTLEQYGAVSEPVVTQMVQGAVQKAKASIGVAVSGIAGPGGGTDTKPVGTVCFGFYDCHGWLQTETQYFSGDRQEIRHQVVAHALSRLIEYLRTLG